MYLYNMCEQVCVRGTADISQAMEHLNIANAKIYSNFTTSRALTASVGDGGGGGGNNKMVMVTTSLFFSVLLIFYVFFSLSVCAYVCVCGILIHTHTHTHTTPKHLDLFGSLLFCHYDFMNIFTAFHFLLVFSICKSTTARFLRLSVSSYVELKVM